MFLNMLHGCFLIAKKENKQHNYYVNPCVTPSAQTFYRCFPMKTFQNTHLAVFAYLELFGINYFFGDVAYY